MSQNDNIAIASRLVGESRSKLESAFETGLGVAGRLRTGFARLSPAKAVGADGAQCNVPEAMDRVRTALRQAAARCEAMGDGPAASGAAEAIEAAIGHIDRAMLLHDSEEDASATFKRELRTVQTTASRPLGTLVSLMQAADAFDQRLSHVSTAIDALEACAVPVRIAAVNVLCAQVDSIGAALTDSRAQIRIALDSVVEMASRAGTKISESLGEHAGGGARDSLAAAAAVIDEIASGIAGAGDEAGELGADLAAVRELLATLLAEAGLPSWKETVAEVLGKLRASEQAVDEWIGADATLADANATFSELQEVLIAYVPAAPTDFIGEIDLGFIEQTYTMEDERSVHAYALSRKSSIFLSENMRGVG